jgi:hypothetical protein
MGGMWEWGSEGMGSADALNKTLESSEIQEVLIVLRDHVGIRIGKNEA